MGWDYREGHVEAGIIMGTIAQRRTLRRRQADGRRKMATGTGGKSSGEWKDGGRFAVMAPGN